MGIGVAAGGCATEPWDNLNVGPTRTTLFSGYASAASAQIVFEYKDPTHPNGWRPFGPSNITASATPWTVSPTTTNIYEWNAGNIAIPLAAFTVESPIYWATVRARQRNGTALYGMYMFDADGRQCLWDNLSQALVDGVPLDAQQSAIDCSEGRTSVSVSRY